MGIRIHVAEVYQLRCSTTTADSFYNRSEAVNKMLYDQCPNITWDGEDVAKAERLEIPRAELANLMAKIVSNRTYFENWRETWNIEENLDRILCVIAEWIAKSDQRNDYVVLMWY
jgi:hypothetical protein